MTVQASSVIVSCINQPIVKVNLSVEEVTHLAEALSRAYRQLWENPDKTIDRVSQEVIEE